MKIGKVLNGWNLAITLLVLVIIAGGVIIFLKNSSSPGIEISLAAPKENKGNIYVSGAVNNPWPLSRVCRRYLRGHYPGGGGS